MNLRLLPIAALVAALSLAALAAGCAVPNDAFCDATHPCADPATACDAELHSCEAIAAAGDAGVAGCGAAAPCDNPALPVCDVETATCGPVDDEDRCAADQPCRDPALPICDLPTGRCEADPAAPSITQLPTTVFDERADVIESPEPGAGADGRMFHSHRDSAELPIVELVAGAECRTIAKHAYLLEKAPHASEAAANPIVVAFEVDDARLDLASLAYRVRHPPTGFTGSWASGSDELGVIETQGAGLRVNVRMHRTAVPELGQRDGLYEVDLRARDLDGHEAVATACFVLDRLPAPLAVREAASATAADALVDQRLDEDDPISAIVNGSQGAGRGKLVTSVLIENYTGDEVIARLQTIAEAETCKRASRSGAVMTGFEAINVECSIEGCFNEPSAAIDNGLAGCSPFAEVPAISLQVVGSDGAVVDECESCPPGAYRIGPAAADGPSRATAELRLDRAAGLSPVGTVAEYTLTYLTAFSAASTRTSRLTGTQSGGPFQRCAETKVVDTGSPDEPELTTFCRKRATYLSYVALTAIELTFGEVGVALERSVAGPFVAQPAVRKVRRVSWSSTESTLPGALP